MGKSRMMGAGNASASLYKMNPNLNTFGGSKKQDIPTRVGIDAWANYGYQTNANGIGRNKLFIMNQIGGVGVGRSMFNTSYVQPRGLRKTVDISDIAYWDGEKHILKKDVTIPPGHSLTHTSTFTVGQGTTLTVHGNLHSHSHLIINGTLHILGVHHHNKMTIASTGSYIVSGTSINSSDEPILKTIISNTETNTSNVNIQGIFTVQSGGIYTNASTVTFTNLGAIVVDTGGTFTNAGIFNNNYGSIFIINGTYQNNGTVNHKTIMSETNGIKGTFSNNGTLQLSLDTGSTTCNMYIVSYSTFTNHGTITIDTNCDFYSYRSWPNYNIINNNGNIIIDRVSALNNNGVLISYNLTINIHTVSKLISPGVYLDSDEASQLINNGSFTNINNFTINKTNDVTCVFTNHSTGTFTNEGTFNGNNNNFINQGTYIPN